MERERHCLAVRDQKTLWHPYTQMKTANPPLPVVRGSGAKIYLEDNHSLIDAISSWWVNLHGHAHPYIAEAIARQANKLEHVLFAGFTHEPAVSYAERLLPKLPGSMTKLFYSDNGSTAVEAALKMAIGYQNRRSLKKKRVLCFQNSFHGDTFGAMASSGKNLFNKPFWSYLFQSTMIPPPIVGQEEKSFSMLQNALLEDDIFAFIYEPALLGAGGMKSYCLQSMNRMLSLVRERHITLIADEVMTGFGRLGPLFASELMDVKPDILCLSKGISGGFLPFAATACNESIYSSFLSDDLQDALLHGHSYTANPLGCAAAIASLDLLLSPSCQERRNHIRERHSEFLKRWVGHARIQRIEALGTILVLEYKNESSTGYFSPFKEALSSHFLDRGILVRPLGSTLYIMPPYCISDDELGQIYSAIDETMESPCALFP